MTLILATKKWKIVFCPITDFSVFIYRLTQLSIQIYHSEVKARHMEYYMH